MPVESARTIVLKIEVVGKKDDTLPCAYDVVRAVKQVFTKQRLTNTITILSDEHAVYTEKVR